jgi:hypothetical protein
MSLSVPDWARARPDKPSADAAPDRPPADAVPGSVPTKRSLVMLWAIGSGAFVAVWSGWVGLGSMCGFGIVHLLPGIWNSFEVNTSITLPFSMEMYGALAMRYWLDPSLNKSTRHFAFVTAIAALVFAFCGQVGYHIMNAHHVTTAPWPVVAAVSCVPVITIGLGSGLMHMVRLSDKEFWDTHAGQAPAQDSAVAAGDRLVRTPAPGQIAGPRAVHIHPRPPGLPWGISPPPPVAEKKPRAPRAPREGGTVRSFARLPDTELTGEQAAMSDRELADALGVTRWTANLLKKKHRAGQGQGAAA